MSRHARSPSERRGRACASAAMLLAVALACGRRACAATLIVDSEGTEDDYAAGDGACRTLSGTCTLAAALQEGAALPGHDRIELPTGSFFDPDLPTIEQDVDIVGTGLSTD